MQREMTRKEILSLADRMADTAAHIDAATHALLTDIRAFDESNGWYELGAKTCAHYLSWRIGMGPGVAREKVRIARALAALPLVDAALAQGRLSYSKVRAITRVATAKNEEVLLDMAMASTAAHLERICRLYRQTAPRERAADERRWVTSRATDDGMVRISLQLRADEAAILLKAIDVAGEGGSQADRAVALAETALAGGAIGGDRTGGVDGIGDIDGARDIDGVCDTGDIGDVDGVGATDDLGGGDRIGDIGGSGNIDGASDIDGVGGGARTGNPGRPRLRRPVEVMFHIDADTLTGHAHDTGDGVSAEVSRRLCCDAGIVPVVSERGKTVDVGRKTRRISAAIERALASRDGGCRFPGCDNRFHLDAHHIQHWLDGGETRLENLILTCRSHHVYLHERGFTVEMTENGPVFRDPDGAVVTETFVRPRLEQPVETLRWRIFADGIEIDPDAQTPDWDGKRPDYEHVIDSLATHGGHPAP